MSKEELKVTPVEQEVKEGDLKKVNGGNGCETFSQKIKPTSRL